ncbi:ribonucleoprotein PTB-binding 2 isoform X2 [Ornithorhynchus anatinus]|uniref:Ribonucleoprotein PTB-binding 1 n=1 Tax=Ornithorhynchus anatinus TaxID=9258 RepID=F6PLR1_ORNAN|nr:ribonucleoprotein PTB-binding 2 isoform X2 [Ornithorhynchus anatinus]
MAAAAAAGVVSGERSGSATLGNEEEKEEKEEEEEEEVTRRLQRTRRELSNRRKILLKNLPRDCHSQEVHELLKDYELKYCYVDRNKRTAFVTLLNGEQAQSAIRTFHQHSLRGKDIVVQFQPTDALLCVTNLPASLTLQEFEELLRAYGNIERCFLVYSEVTGQSKGYGFVEYMKKDSAAKARVELMGKELRAGNLFAQWMDVNQLTPDLIHSKCLCVDKLPSDFSDSDELVRLFSRVHNPVFCQFAQDEGSYVGGFAVVEYDTAEQAEEVQRATHGMTIQGTKVRVAFCAPGSPGRSTLAALIAAQQMMLNNQKGLLPEPNPIQIMKSLNNPAMLQILLQPQLRGCAGKPAGLGVPHSLPHLMNPTINPAFLQMNPIHQVSGLGNSSRFLLQNLCYLQVAQQQLMKIDSLPSNSKPGLLGEPPATVLQAALGMGPTPLKAELGHHGESLKAPTLASPPTAASGGMGAFPFFPNQHVVGPALPASTQDQPAGPAEGAGSGPPQPYLQSFTGLPPAGLRTGPLKQHSQPKSTEASSGIPCINQSSLLGEPPREIRLSTNPYLNLASVLPGACLPPPGASKTSPLQQLGISKGLLDAAFSQGAPSQQALENYLHYSQQFGDYAPGSTLRSEKRGSSSLISAPEGGSAEPAGRRAEGPGGYPPENLLKKKRVY